MSCKAWVVMVGLAACGPGVKSSSPAQPARSAARSTGLEQLLAARGDAAAVGAQLKGPVTLGGVWFPTEACRATFAQPGLVPTEQLPALAACLATLPLTASARDSVVPGLRLVAYEPGLELEVMFARDEPSQIRYVGFVSRVLAEDSAPTITQQAFDALIAQRSLAELGAEQLWAKVCIDADGQVVSARLDRTTSPAIVAPVLAQVKQWRATPFQLAGVPTAACSVLRLGTAAPDEANAYVPRVAEPGQGEAITIAVAALGERTATAASMVPSDDDKRRMARAGVAQTTASVRFCVGADGRVQGAWTAFPSGMPDYDAMLVASAKQWQYPPRTEPACAYLDVVYRQR